MTITGSYKPTFSPATAEVVAFTKYKEWRILEGGHFMFGDPKVPEAMIEGEWREQGGHVFFDIETVGGRPALKEPHTSDTRFHWDFLIKKSGNDLKLVADDSSLR